MPGRRLRIAARAARHLLKGADDETIAEQAERYKFRHSGPNRATAVTLSTFLSLSMAILGLAGIAGGAVAVLTAARRREMDRIARDDRQSLIGRVETLEAEKERDKATIAQLQAQVSVLAEMVTQAAAVSELANMISGQHSIVVDRLDRMLAAMPKRSADAGS